jgi:hypothetical protein
LSHVLFCLYIDGLLMALSQAGVGCYKGDNFVAALAYVDDIVLLAPVTSALRTMFVICDNYANDCSVTFSASKFKYLVVLPGNRRFLHDYKRKSTFYVGDNPMVYTDCYVAYIWAMSTRASLPMTMIF